MRIWIWIHDQFFTVPSTRDICVLRIKYELKELWMNDDIFGGVGIDEGLNSNECFLVFFIFCTYIITKLL